MEILDNFGDELITIQENIEQSFINLCKLWDQIGVFSDSKRNELKTKIVNGSVDAVTNYLNSIYDSELEVIISHQVSFIEQKRDGTSYQDEREGSC